MSPLAIWRGTLNAGAAALIFSSIQPATQMMHQVGLMSDPAEFNRALDTIPLAHVARTSSNEVVQALIGVLGMPPAPPGGGVGPDLQSNGTLEFSQ
ncbi:hypothetical protein HLH33_00560 [Gluconacetobacter diazotrophicus]|uniref:Uncharacterized protein n=1 Tax=Gluconacetobacter diazotrophicus TaxID=33996 RepID=A0A7W4FBY1_GLUDI|nr:hypothetical protein [Gluconacetobacter diazotrophicus]MBB2154812.1 hypothetical protein [Gluconacetobacter diazotrophicus]